MGRVLTPYRAGVTTDGVPHNKYRSRCWGRGACSRRAGGCDIHASFDSPTGLILPAMETGKVILSDRFVSSTLAYQLGGEDLTADEIRDSLASARSSGTMDCGRA